MIIITNNDGQRIRISINDSTVMIDADHRWVYISKEDARELRRFLELIG